MFFADSTDSLGLQIADLCNYFVRLHLVGVAEKGGVLDFEGLAEKNALYELISRKWSVRSRRRNGGSMDICFAITRTFHIERYGPGDS
jgi:hypothetical protein